MTTAQRVIFPFDQALPAATALWTLAGHISNDVAPARAVAAKTALTDWQGSFSDDFTTSMQNSTTSAADVVAALQGAARDLAMQWAAANHQQQLYLYYAMVKNKRDQRSALDQIGSFILGSDDSEGAPPGPPATPSPPDFAPTSVPQAKVPGQSQPSLS